jgi:hypothetical protein
MNRRKGIRAKYPQGPGSEGVRCRETNRSKMKMGAGNLFFPFFRMRCSSVNVVNIPERKKKMSMASDDPRVNCCGNVLDINDSASCADWNHHPTVSGSLKKPCGDCEIAAHGHLCSSKPCAHVV